MKQQHPEHGVVLMLGTSFETMGGVASVVRLLGESRLFKECGVIYLTTHRDGSRWQKLLTALSAWLRFVAHLFGGRLRLLHVHMSSDSSFWRTSCFMVPAVMTGTPFIIHMHGAAFVGFNANLPGVGKRFVRWIFQRSALLIALSPEWKRRLQLISGHDRIEVVANPVAIPSERSSAFRKPRTLLFLGNIGRRKGCYVLLEAMVAVQSTHPDVRLLCGGDGDHETFLRDAAQRGVARNIQLLGWVKPPAKRRLLARSTVFVLPSYAEGLPMALLEAMAAGMAIVATPVGGIPDAVRDGVDGLLVPAGDAAALASAISRLLSDAELREGLGASARARAVELFGIDQAVDRIERIYRQVSNPAQRERSSAPTS